MTSWDEYVMSSDRASLYHLSGWREVIEKSFGHATHYLSAEDSTAVHGILPLVHMKSLSFGNFLVSLPYFNYGGIVADDPAISEQLYREAIELAQKVGAEHIELRQTDAIPNLPARTSKVSMRRALPDHADDLWKSFPAKLRSQVQRPMKAGMSCRVGREESLDAFYAVFAANMRDLGTPVYAKKFFRNILRAFPDSSWICTVFTERGKPVASGFLLGFKNVLEIPWASSLREYNKYGPNMMLYWEALKLACNRNFRVFDFGRSTPHEGTYRFKQQWGATPVSLYWQYWVKDNKPMPEINPKNPKYQLAIKIWKTLPLCITNTVGPVIVRNIP